jgi:hypothetical protein
MDDLLRFHHLSQGAIRRLLLGLAAQRDRAEMAAHPCGEHPRWAVGQRVERRLQLLEGLSGGDWH